MDDRHWECSGGQCVQVGEFKAGLVDKAGNLIGTVHQHLAANNDHSFTATWTEEHDGEFVTRTQWEEGNRATGPTETGERTEVVGAASYEVVESKDASGKKTTTYKTTIYYNDRTSDTWITVVDENGNIISDTGPSPEDSFEPPADPCASLMFDDPQHMEREITKMDTQIIPAIDSPLQAVDDPCFSSQSRQTLEACVSVWLCLDGKVDRDCKCVVPAQAVPDTPYAAQCQHQMCEEGYHCDPASGTCVGTVDGETIHMPGIGGTPFPMPYARRQLSLVRAHMEADRLIEMADQIRSGAINSPAEFR